MIKDFDKKISLLEANCELILKNYTEYKKDINRKYENIMKLSGTNIRKNKKIDNFVYNDFTDDAFSLKLKKDIDFLKNSITFLKKEFLNDIFYKRIQLFNFFAKIFNMFIKIIINGFSFICFCMIFPPVSIPFALMISDVKIPIFHLILLFIISVFGMVFLCFLLFYKNSVKDRFVFDKNIIKLREIDHYYRSEVKK